MKKRNPKERLIRLLPLLFMAICIFAAFCRMTNLKFYKDILYSVLLQFFTFSTMLHCLYYAYRHKYCLYLITPIYTVMILNIINVFHLVADLGKTKFTFFNEEYVIDWANVNMCTVIFIGLALTLYYLRRNK